MLSAFAWEVFDTKNKLNAIGPKTANDVRIAIRSYSHKFFVANSSAQQQPV